MPGPIVTDADLVGEALSCRRGGRLVFAGLDFSLKAGGALLLTGSNGSGKSSLLRLLATLLTPEAGRLLWAGEPVAADPARYRAALAYAGHLDALKPALSAARRCASGRRCAAPRTRTSTRQSRTRSTASGSVGQPMFRAAFCRLDSGGGWRWPGFSLLPPRSGCSTSRPPRSTATARPGCSRQSPRTGRQAEGSPLRRICPCRCPAPRRSGSTITPSRRRMRWRRHGDINRPRPSPMPPPFPSPPAGRSRISTGEPAFSPFPGLDPEIAGEGQGGGTAARRIKFSAG